MEISKTFMYSVALIVTLYMPHHEDHHYTKEVVVKPLNGERLGFEFQANDGRPLDQLVAYFNNQYGWLLDYEDPPYSSKRELVGSVTKEWLRQGGKEYYVPSGGAFSIVLTAGELQPGAPTFRASVEKLAKEYNASANPGRFSVVMEEAGRLSLVGTQVRDDSGSWRSIRPILDQPVQLPKAKRSVMQGIQEIAAQLSAETGHQVKLATIPFAFLQQVNYTGTGDAMAARQQLSLLLDATHAGMAWSLLYDVNDNSYYLNLPSVGSYGPSQGQVFFHSRKR